MCVPLPLRGVSCTESLTDDLEEVILAIMYAYCQGSWKDLMRDKPEMVAAKMHFKSAWWQWARREFPTWWEHRHHSEGRFTRDKYHGV